MRQWCTDLRSSSYVFSSFARCFLSFSSYALNVHVVTGVPDVSVQPCTSNRLIAIGGGCVCTNVWGRRSLETFGNKCRRLLHENYTGISFRRLKFQIILRPEKFSRTEFGQAERADGVKKIEIILSRSAIQSFQRRYILVQLCATWLVVNIFAHFTSNLAIFSCIRHKETAILTTTVLPTFTVIFR